MSAELISSPGNPLLKRIRKLRRRKQRDAEGALFVEGIAPVWQALDSGAEVEVVVVAPHLLTSEGARELVGGLPERGIRVVSVTGEAFAAVAEREHPAGLGAIVQTPRPALRDVAVGGSSLVVALHEVGNPGNLGTIVRTADAAGAAGVVVTGTSADPWDPASVKASMGTVFSTPVVATSLEELLAWAREGGLPVVATSERGAVDVWEAALPAVCVLLFGSEATGLPPDVLAGADLSVRIPQVGAASSLNLAVAAGILIYESRRGRIPRRE
ncbi:MAG: RNA methyltransferase [Actinomycetota bacterium]|nr:RNA methyltransferase [Actinomycetota bacterium]